jgi:hypothetical protein
MEFNCFLYKKHRAEQMGDFHPGEIERIKKAYFELKRRKSEVLAARGVNIIFCLKFLENVELRKSLKPFPN